MATATPIHVTPRPDGKWQVIRGGGEKASAVTDTQAEAIEIAKGYSHNDGAQVIVHGRGGKIRKSW
ncbi:MAG: DUF2188 domain-containing protein [Clostridiales bacterium]|jgi:hypothetical protein|nr:DUF2188 domain-containing protein [Clostridiales bacterium]